MGWKISKPLGNTFGGHGGAPPPAPNSGLWYQNQAGVHGQNDINELLKAYRDPNKGYDSILNPHPTYQGTIDKKDIEARIKELSGADVAGGATDDEIRLALQGLQEKTQREDLGKKQQGQINDFATQQEGAVGDYRKILAQHLSDTAQQTFAQANPGILEDLNSRGLFTSQTARDDSQNRALSQLASQQQQQLSNFDTSQFNNIQDIRGSALSAMLGGNQSALDAALELRKAGMQRSFDVADQQRNQAFQQMLADQQSRQQMIGSILGLGGSLGSAYLGGL